MATAKVQYNTLVSKLSLPDSADEISALAFAVLQHLGVSRTDILSDREVHLNQDQLQSVIERLNQHEPVQYIFNEAWFYGRNFFVDSNVLIPRPETELIIDIAKKNFSRTDVFSVLDIGTGSGCIAVTLALEFPNAKITATDVSVSALQVAQRNANNLGATVNFIGHDILKGFSPNSKCDLLVSNPPYIAHSEKASIPQNVLQYEPHLALFAAEDDALIFYRAIFKSAWAILKIGQLLAVEINERLAVQVVQMLELMGFSAIEIHQDLYGKDRVVTARMV